jgi:hypothetical protein
MISSQSLSVPSTDKEDANCMPFYATFRVLARAGVKKAHCPFWEGPN